MAVPTYGSPWPSVRNICYGARGHGFNFRVTSEIFSGGIRFLVQTGHKLPSHPISLLTALDIVIKSLFSVP